MAVYSHTVTFSMAGLPPRQITCPWCSGYFSHFYLTLEEIFRSKRNCKECDGTGYPPFPLTEFFEFTEDN